MAEFLATVFTLLLPYIFIFFSFLLTVALKVKNIFLCRVKWICECVFSMSSHQHWHTENGAKKRNKLSIMWHTESCKLQYLNLVFLQNGVVSRLFVFFASFFCCCFVLPIRILNFSQCHLVALLRFLCLRSDVCRVWVCRMYSFHSHSSVYSGNVTVTQLTAPHWSGLLNKIYLPWSYSSGTRIMNTHSKQSMDPIKYMLHHHTTRKNEREATFQFKYEWCESKRIDKITDRIRSNHYNDWPATHSTSLPH